MSVESLAPPIRHLSNATTGGNGYARRPAHCVGHTVCLRQHQHDMKGHSVTEPPDSASAYKNSTTATKLTTTSTRDTCAMPTPLSGRLSPDDALYVSPHPSSTVAFTIVMS